jgi:very-short-patch-repair endonuclease
MDWQDLARDQHGVVARRQLSSCRLSEFQIDGLIRRRELRPIHPGVYTPRPVPTSFQQRMWAAVLWCDGVVSHRSAAAVFGDIPAPRTDIIHLTIGRPFQGRIAGVMLHRVPLPTSEIVMIDSLPVTSRTRTMIDLLRVERYPVARDLLDRAVSQRWLELDSVRHAVSVGLGRTGNVQLRKLISAFEAGAQAESERILHRLLRRAAVEGWEPQYRVRLASSIAYLDVGFPQQRLAIEVDGRRTHDELSGRFESDRSRQNELQAQGWRVLRFTWRMLMDEPDAVIAKIKQLLTLPIRQDLAV